MRKLCINFFFITVLCLMPISKKAPFSALETLVDVFFYPFCKHRGTVVVKEASLSSRMQMRIIFCCVDCWSFCVLPKEEISVWDDRWELFFSLVLREDFFSHFLNGFKGEIFSIQSCFASSVNVNVFFHALCKTY